MWLWMLTELFYGNHFAIDTYYIKSLCCTSKTSTVLSQLKMN